MKRTKIFGLALTVALLPSVSLAQDLVIQLAHDNNPDPLDNPGHACAAVFGNIVRSETNGAIDVEFFPNDQVGTNIEQVQMTRDGVVQATISSTGAIASYYPKIDVLNLPFAFSGNAATYEVFDGRFGELLKADIEEDLGDVVVLGFPDTGGFFAVTNSSKPIVDVADFQGVRVRTMTLPSHQVIMNAMGAESYPLAWGELYSALQTGVIDGQMNPVPIISFANLGEVQGYMTLTNHLFSPYIFLMNREVWDDLTPEHQKIVTSAAQSCVTASRGLARIIEASDRGVTGLSDLMEISALNQAQRDEMRDVTQPAFEAHINDQLGEDAVALLEALKEDAQLANNATYLISN